MRRRIVLLRHGEVSYFPTPGTKLDPRAVSLTEHGKEQARAAGELLSEMPFDLLLTSGLPRTRETAELVLAGREVAASREDPDLEELRTNFRNLPSVLVGGDIQRVFSQAFLLARDPDATFLGGEKFTDMRERVLGVWRRLLDDRSWKTALVVAHGGVNRALLAHAIGAPPSSYGHFEQDPACINVLDVDQYEDGTERHIVRLLNHTPYAADKQRFRLTTMEDLFAKFTGREPDL